MFWKKLVGKNLFQIFFFKFKGQVLKGGGPKTTSRPVFHIWKKMLRNNILISWIRHINPVKEQLFLTKQALVKSVRYVIVVHYSDFKQKWKNLHERITGQLPLKCRLLHVELFNLFPAQLQLGVQRLGLLQVLGQVIHVAVRVEVVNLELNKQDWLKPVSGLLILNNGSQQSI